MGPGSSAVRAPDVPVRGPGAARRAGGRLLAEPFRLEGRHVEVGPSVGVAVQHENSYGSAEQVIREADTAMYREKQRGR